MPGSAGLAALLAVGLLAAACAGPDDGTDNGDRADTPTTSAGQPVPGGDIIFAVETEADGYNPIGNRWAASAHLIGSAIYEPLLVETGDGELDPWLAESVEPNDDATVWTITVKDGITFHDGSALDGEAVAANIRGRLASPMGAIALEQVDEVEVIGPGTVEVRMASPWGAFDHTLASQTGYMISMAMVDGDETDPVGTGPFKFVNWVQDAYVEVEKNPDYWGDDVYLDSIRFEIIPDVLARQNALEAGNVDGIVTSHPPSISAFRTDDGIIEYEDSSQPMMVILNSGAPPFDSRLAREALAAGTNPEGLITAVGGDEVLERATSPFVTTNPWHLEDNGYPAYDPAEARSLVEAYEDETGKPLSVTIKLGLGLGEEEANVLQAQWDALGVDTSIEPIEQSVFVGDTISGNYEAAMFSLHGWVDPDFSYMFWLSDNAEGAGGLNINLTQVENDALDAAIEKGRTSLEREVRKEANDDIQRILNEELTNLWLYEIVGTIATQTDLHGFGDAADRGFTRSDAKVFWKDVWQEQ